jgi:hypothetical protein
MNLCSKILCKFFFNLKKFKNIKNIKNNKIKIKNGFINPKLKKKINV